VLAFSTENIDLPEIHKLLQEAKSEIGEPIAKSEAQQTRREYRHSTLPLNRSVSLAVLPEFQLTAIPEHKPDKALHR
jgi:hypothetical protein